MHKVLQCISNAYCYKNIHCWPGPYSFSSSLSPSTYTRRTTRTYTCNTYSGWLYSLLTFTGYIPFDHVLTRLYYICSPDPRLASPMPFPLYWYSPYYTLNPLPYYRSMMTSPLTFTASLVGDSLPVIFTIVSVCDSVPPLPLPYYQSLTQFPFCLPISVLLLTAWSVLKFPTYINPVYHSCIP